MCIENQHFTLCFAQSSDLIPKLNLSKVFSILGIKDTPVRRESYLTSRYALFKALKSIRSPIAWDNLFVVKNTYIPAMEHLRVSLSHTKEISAAVVTNSQKTVGVDIERSSRAMRQGAEKYFLNSNDRVQHLSLLQQWVAKEACYKAASNYYQQEFLLKDVVIQNDKFSYKDIEGHIRFMNYPEHIVAVAYA